MQSCSAERRGHPGLGPSPRFQETACDAERQMGILRLRQCALRYDAGRRRRREPVLPACLRR
jgi:hypothetical protein